LTDAEVWSGNRPQDKDIIEKYLEINQRYSQPVSAEDNPFLSQNNGGVEITKFIPTSCARSNLNNHSIVTIVSHAASKMLIPGDNEPSSWEELLENKDFVTGIEDTDILLAPHHGTDSGFSDNLFNYISPGLTIISDGRFCDTSATVRYSKKSSGWKVHKRSDGSEQRKCVTTRNDGVIVVEFGKQSDATPYIRVTID
jgi:competence protein ComEC